jgi:hypothetical protein
MAIDRGHGKHAYARAIWNKRLLLAAHPDNVLAAGPALVAFRKHFGLISGLLFPVYYSEEFGHCPQTFLNSYFALRVSKQLNPSLRSPLIASCV